MKNFLIVLAITVFSLYAVVSFITLLPNPASWETGGRIAFVLFSFIISGSFLAFKEHSKN
jgi:hypothetical protein